MQQWPCWAVCWLPRPPREWVLGSKEPGARACAFMYLRGDPPPPREAHWHAALRGRDLLCCWLLSYCC